MADARAKAVAEGTHLVSIGEPVTYTNWTLRGLTTVQEAFVFVSMIDGKWRIGTPESLQRVGIALLEKEVDRLDKPLENR